MLKFTKLAAGLLVLVFVSFLIPYALWNFATHAEPYPDGFYMGVIELGDNAETKRLIDETKDFTNLIVISNMQTIRNQTLLEEIVDYAHNAGLSFFVRMTYPTRFENFTYNPFEWVQTAEGRYGDRFLGYYLYDEPGGNQMDLASFRQFDNTSLPCNYRDAANTFVYYLYLQMRDFIKTDKLVTSDYGLYWFDYEAGYDAVFAEFGWNHPRPLNIALCRGAAEMHNKTWGVTITWETTSPPHLESPEELYSDLVTAYNAGAKYIIIYNEPRLETHGLLTPQHLNALKNFKDYANQNPQTTTSNTQKIAYVMPDNYGSGLRSVDDRIWGVWSADNNSAVIWNDLQTLIGTYGDGFDVIYDSPWTRLFGRAHYETLIWWNGTKTALNVPLQP